jgi:PQQ-like domain
LTITVWCAGRITGNNYSVPAGICTAPGQTGCTQPAADDYLDSILALRLGDGTVAWVDHTLDTHLWTLPQPSGPDFDFGAGPNLFTIRDPVTGRTRQLLGIGQKSGVYWAVDPATGKVAWQTVVGPAGNGGTGGIEYGTATDGRRIYAAEGDTARIPYTLGGSGPYAGQVVTGGSWAALDPATGKILWQTPDPHGDFDTSFVTVANGVMYAGSLASASTNMYALDAATGTILWSFASGGSVTGGASIADGSVYWGSGYCGTACLAAEGMRLDDEALRQVGMTSDFSTPLAVLRVAGSEPGQFGPVGHAELGINVRKVHFYRIAGHEQRLSDVRVIQALAGKLDHLPLDRAQAGPPVRGARMLPAAALGVGDGLLKRQSGPLLECFFKILVAQCGADGG